MRTNANTKCRIQGRKKSRKREKRIEREGREKKRIQNQWKGGEKSDSEVC